MPNILFNIHHIEIEQFAAIEEPKQKNVKFNIAVKPGCNSGQKAVAISIEAKFIEDNHPFLLLKTNAFFQLAPESWDELTDSSTGKVIIPEAFVISLVQISISQARGILCAKTDATPFAKFILPIVNVSNFSQKGDMVILPDGSIEEK